MCAGRWPAPLRGAEGVQLSAEVEPFVPKHAAVAMAWTESSVACMSPTYFTPCYPFFQNPSLDKHPVYPEDLPQDDFSSLSQRPSHRVMGAPAFCEYSSSSYSPDVVSNMYPIAGSYHPGNNSAPCNDSGLVSQSAQQKYPTRQESKNLSKRRSKEDEKKSDKKEHDREQSSVKIVNRTSSQSTAWSRDSMKPDSYNKTTSKKSTQTPKIESLPLPAFETTLLDFHKSQSFETSETWNVHHRSGPVCSAESNFTCLSQPEMSPWLNGKEDVSVENKAPSKTLNEAVASLIPSSFDGREAFPKAPTADSAQPGLTWAMVLSQPPKKTPLSPASEGLPRGKEKQGSPVKEEINTVDNETENKEASEKKKKKKKKKKKNKSPTTDVEETQNKPTATQEPPRIEDAEEFPDLVTAFARRTKLGSQKSPLTPAVKKEVEIHYPKASWDSSSPTQDRTPKVDGLSWKQAPSLPLGRKKMQETSKSNSKKSQTPVQLDLGGMLAVLEQKQQTEKSKQSSKPVVFSVGGAIPLLSKEPATATKSRRLNQGKMPHNPLDSSAPLVKKGKQREVPKAKRPTPLKKIILKEREQRKQQHLLEQTATLKDGDTCLPAENTTEGEPLPQASEAAVPVMQVTEGFLESTGTQESTKESTESSMASKQLNCCLPKIHSRRFRDYCSQVLSKEVDSCVTDLLKELVRFQDRMYQKDPVKAKIRRRLVMGLREVLKHLRLNRLKCVIISPNCEKIQSKGGLDETLHNIIDCACEQNIPFVFALNRRALGRCVNKSVPVSVVGIFSYDGAQDHFHRMVQLTEEARKAYRDMIAAFEEEAEGRLRETELNIVTTEHEKSFLSDTDKTASSELEDVPNYIKIWKRKLEEEYNPYALELAKSATANSEEHHLM
ncbi:selenocysteine insertion sequence-binding protein 2 isoform X2 [Anas platyrhynchos]|uniref:selenocysteine insertion sequence-binding protein 2 isoform X2 n=1 Tax=Anas platyrhynchos TaxID=8839 RepID=UPI0018D612B6|nr:selenocysteine insertion sequence-binding protein 2 isoform X2 [Anas platyrhynchos]